MENVIEHKFIPSELFFVYPQEGEGRFLPDMIIKVSNEQMVYLIEDKKVVKELRIGTNAITDPYSGFVIFLNKGSFEVKWGTLEPVPFKDKNLSLIYIKAYGIVNFLIEDGKKFIEKLIKEKEFYLSEEFVEFLRNLVFFEFSNILKENIAQLNLESNFKKTLRELVSKNLDLKFKNIGLKLLDFNIIGGNFIEDEKEEEKKLQKIIFCRKCKKEIQFLANFCPFCGEKISNICSSCQKEIPEFAKFCPFCGTKL